MPFVVGAAVLRYLHVVCIARLVGACMSSSWTHPATAPILVCSPSPQPPSPYPPPPPLPPIPTVTYTAPTLVSHLSPYSRHPHLPPCCGCRPVPYVGQVIPEHGLRVRNQQPPRPADRPRPPAPVPSPLSPTPRPDPDLPQPLSRLQPTPHPHLRLHYVLRTSTCT